MTTTEIVAYQKSSLATRASYAQTLAGAADLIPRGLFDKQTGRPSPAKILLVMETGAMLGLAPMAALAGIDVIEGKAAISPRVALGLFRSAGHKVQIIETGTVETGDLKVTVILTRKDDPENPIDASFTPQQALRAGLIDSYQQNTQTGLWEIRARSSQGKVLPWEAYTEDLCLWRAVGRLGRRGGQDVLMGIGYIPEELDARIDEDGVIAESITVEAEDEVIARFKQYDDKAHMAAFWASMHPMGQVADAWTGRVAAEFDAHLATLTKDSRPPKDGAPGHTGDPSVDGPASDTDPNVVDAEVVGDENGQGDEAPAEPSPTTPSGEAYYDEDPSAGARRLQAEDEEADRAAATEPRRELSVADADAQERAELRRRAEEALGQQARDAAAREFQAGPLEGLSK